MVLPDAEAREADGKRPSQSVIDKMAYVTFNLTFFSISLSGRELNIHAMRLGPGKHLKGRILMNGLVKPEEFDYFHEVCYALQLYNITLQPWYS